MSGWTAEAVRAAAAAWVWIPPDATQVLTDEYQLAAYPAHYNTSPVRVLWSRSARPPGELISEITGYVLAWGHRQVHWVISGSTSPAGTEVELLRRGAELTETVQVLAYDIAGGLPDLAVPDSVRSEVVVDEPSLRAAQLVSTEVWADGRAPTEADVARELQQVSEELEKWTNFRVVSFIDGQPAGFGGCGLADGVARLWGAGTLSALRGHGAYRAVLARRMAVAREHGATLALVKGKVETSAPILRRAGFTAYGEERVYRVPLGGQAAADGEALL